MKYCFAILLFVPVMLPGQVLKKKDIAPLCLTFTAGMFEGTAEALKFHYDRVDRKLSLNDSFWDPEISWRNKYKNGDPAQGERFTGSSTTLVWTTDGYHAMRFGRNACIMTGMSLKFGDKQKWYEYLLEIIAYYLSYQLGFTVTYDLIFK